MKPLTRKEFLALTALLAMPPAVRAAMPQPGDGSPNADSTATAASDVPGWEKVTPAVSAQAALFPLGAVQLLDSPFKQAMETDRTYLLTLDPDRLLAAVRQVAGLTPKAPHYGGWDSGGASTVGHYLSACAIMAAATGDPLLHKRVDYLISELAVCQQANGDGGLYGFGWDKTEYFRRLAAGDVIHVNTSAWYLLHKTFAGLRDAYLLADNTQARDVLIRMSDWAIAVTAKLTDAQWQEMLGPPDKMGEFGGPHEVFADVYAMTGDRKYLTLAEKFRHALVFDPLLRDDTQILTGRHANTEIPKFVGYERIYDLTGEADWHNAAENFWQDVVANRTWANGGDGQWEHFFSPKEFEKNLDARCGPETCASYNMLKLTQQLYTRASSARYIDFYERALYNSILPSQAPGGGFVYYTSMRPGHYRVFSRPFDAFWCCVGTGMENHGKYGEMIYAHDADRLRVNLFIPSILTWNEKGLTLRQETAFPEEPKTRLALTLKQPRRMTLSIRSPKWVSPGALTVRVNGKTLPSTVNADGYVDVTRLWKSGDSLEIGLPMHLTTEPLPQSQDYAAFFYGPILLAGELGTEGLTRDDFYGGGDNTNIENQLATKSLPLSKVPILIGTPETALTHIKPVSGKPLVFQTQGLAKPEEVTLVPFYRLYFQRYALYWPFKTQEAYDQEQKEVQDLEKRTVDHVLIGETQSETDYHLATDNSHTGGAGEPFTHWRDATGWFSYDVKVLPDHPVALRCAYWGSDGGRTFDILVAGQTITTQTLTGQKPNEYLYVTTPIPAELTRGKERVTVRFAPKPGGTAGGLFDLRVMRAD